MEHQTNIPQLPGRYVPSQSRGLPGGTNDTSKVVLKKPIEVSYDWLSHIKPIKCVFYPEQWDNYWICCQTKNLCQGILCGNRSLRSPNWTWAATKFTVLYSNGVCFGFLRVDFFFKTWENQETNHKVSPHIFTFLLVSNSLWYQLPKGGLVTGHDKPIHGSCAIYFPGGITLQVV